MSMLLKRLLIVTLFLNVFSVYAGSLAPWNSNHKVRNFHFENKRAVIITTSYSTLDTIDPQTGEVIKVGKPTGLYPSEMTGPYYEFVKANIDVDIASIKGGKIPFEPNILNSKIKRTKSDSKYLKDIMLQEKVNHSLSIENLKIDDYDIVFLAGGWGAAYDFAQSDLLGKLVSEAYAKNKIIGAICHGPLGFFQAQKLDGSPLVNGLKVTAVTDRQIQQLGIEHTPIHPERDLKAAGAIYFSERHWLRDFFASRVLVDGLIVTGQNQKSDLEASEKIMDLLERQTTQNPEII